MGRKMWKSEGEKSNSKRKRDCLEEQEVRKLTCSEAEEISRVEKNGVAEKIDAVNESGEGKRFFSEFACKEAATKNKGNKINYPKSRDEQLLNHPSDWTVENIDEVAKAVKVNPLAEKASVFWNTYRGSFNAISYNDPLRTIILKVKKAYSAYYPIPDEEYLGDVMALMGTKMLSDWLPEKETLEHYIRCRCRPHAEYGRSILKAHGNKVYALVKNDGQGSFNVCEINKYNLTHYPGYTKKYVNQQILSIDAIVQEDGEHLFNHLYHHPRYGFDQSEKDSIRQWLMKTCHVTEYEMQICEAIAAYGKCLDATIVQEINAAIVIPSGNPPMTQKELSMFNNRIHKRAQYHYQKAMEGIR